MSADASLPPAHLLYSTEFGEAWVGDSLQGVRDNVDDGSVSLFMTSPPFALRRKKEYGNRTPEEYIEWFVEFAKVFWDKLADDGSLVIDLGGSWNPGHPTRSLYQFELLLTLCKDLGEKNYHLAQEFYWYNPAKMPSPAQWVTVERIRVKDAVNVVWWLSKTKDPKASNRRVLKPYSDSMKKQLKRGSYNSGRRPGQQNVSKEAWNTEHKGSIPANQITAEHAVDASEIEDNWLAIANTDSASTYHRRLREAFANATPEQRAELEARVRNHPARFPLELPSFFIDFLTDSPGDLVIDPFAGSNVTGEAAERAGRRWKAFELSEPYLQGSVARFESVDWRGDGQPAIGETSTSPEDG